MGIKGLLPLLSDISKPRHLSDFAGQTAGVDGYVWLHRAAFSYSTALGLAESKLAQVKLDKANVDKDSLKSQGGKGDGRKSINAKTLQDDEYNATLRDCESDLASIYQSIATCFLRYCNILIENDITPYVVFDGAELPMKKGVEIQRKQTRNENMTKALHLHDVGRKDEAHRAFAGACDIRPELAAAVSKLLTSQGTKFIVAPYEADAQLAYLSMNNLVHFCISEDSDLLAFGVTSVLYKLDLTGSLTGQHICLDRDYSKLTGNSLLGKGKLLDIVKVGNSVGGGVAATAATSGAGGNEYTASETPGVTVMSAGLKWCLSEEFERFLAFCILQGCDYGKTQIPKAGPKKGCELVVRANGADAGKLSHVAMFQELDIDQKFVKDFTMAYYCFRFQSVYCPTSKVLKPWMAADMWAREIVAVLDEPDDISKLLNVSSKWMPAEEMASLKKKIETLQATQDDEKEKCRSSKPELTKESKKYRRELLFQIAENREDLFAGLRHGSGIGVAQAQLHPDSLDAIEVPQISAESAAATGKSSITKRYYKPKKKPEPPVVPEGQLDILSFFAPVQGTTSKSGPVQATTSKRGVAVSETVGSKVTASGMVATSGIDGAMTGSMNASSSSTNHDASTPDGANKPDDASKPRYEHIVMNEDPLVLPSEKLMSLDAFAADIEDGGSNLAGSMDTVTRIDPKKNGKGNQAGKGASKGKAKKVASSKNHTAAKASSLKQQTSSSNCSKPKPTLSSFLQEESDSSAVQGESFVDDFLHGEPAELEKKHAIPSKVLETKKRRSLLDSVFFIGTARATEAPKEGIFLDDFAFNDEDDNSNPPAGSSRTASYKSATPSYLPAWKKPKLSVGEDNEYQGNEDQNIGSGKSFLVESNLDAFEFDSVLSPEKPMLTGRLRKSVGSMSIQEQISSAAMSTQDQASSTGETQSVLSSNLSADSTGDTTQNESCTQNEPLSLRQRISESKSGVRNQTGNKRGCIKDSLKEVNAAKGKRGSVVTKRGGTTKPDAKAASADTKAAAADTKGGSDTGSVPPRSFLDAKTHSLLESFAFCS